MGEYLRVLRDNIQVGNDLAGPNQHTGYSTPKRWGQNNFPLDENFSEVIFSKQGLLGS